MLCAPSLDGCPMNVCWTWTRVARAAVALALAASTCAPASAATLPAAGHDGACCAKAGAAERVVPPCCAVKGTDPVRPAPATQLQTVARVDVLAPAAVPSFVAPILQADARGAARSAPASHAPPHLLSSVLRI